MIDPASGEPLDEQPEVASQPSDGDASKGSRPPIVTLILGLAALALGLYVATQVVGVLYNIVAPPIPPLPTGAQQLSHTNIAYGVDRWTYWVDMDSCSLVPYYESLGAFCEYAPLQCLPGGSTMTPFTAVQTGVARCTGEVSFSIFTMGYEIGISRPIQDVYASELNVRREVYWTRTSN